ncbi:MAG: hypothetical protein IJM79_00025 [Erysipelotrichaceae bacterium]|nr:hypothetical protein [Erysipelotrichaceae bacterium]
MIYQKTVEGNFDEIVERITQGIMSSRTGYSVTEEANYQTHGHKVAVRMIQRFASTIGERVALQLTFIQQDDEQVEVCGIASGFEGLLFLHSPSGQKEAIETLKKITEEL